ncbi:hypothetical protein EXIGLDRAFT_805556 [Exidia glandulosa HHB12029]|uniref:F-box domain-containing protein n=1 Tax=Exidia glandulosa HHB12029 TaxID=1314781 RepID=A0A165ZQ73_EXIGL|nr:hypothetical protein EXIGLDRAFT_805556 [Exidia glandulosa HHB12029]
MTTAQSTAAHMRKRLYDDMDALEGVERAVLDAQAAREKAQAALELAQAGFDMAVANEQDLLERRAALCAGTLRLRNSLQTMATFPPEILAMVCAEAVSVRWEENASAIPAIDWGAARAPSRFSLVNRHWRHAILSAPRCWTYLVIGVVIPSETVEPMLQQVDLFLQRSRSLLIDVNLAMAWTATEVQADGILRLLMANLRRIRSLRICTGPGFLPRTPETAIQYNEMFLPKIVALLQRPTPELVHLQISCDGADLVDEEIYWQGFPDDFPFLLPTAPKLQSLFVSSAPILCARPHPIGLPSLRTLVLNSGLPVYDSLLWDTIAMAPQLDVLVVEVESGGESAGHPLQLPDSIPITRLKLHADATFPAEVECPRLQRFEFASWRLDTFPISDSMCSTITTLLLEDARFAADEVDAMRSLHVVEHASVSGAPWRVDDAQFYTLLCNAVDPMWPRLRHLELWRVQSSVNVSERNGLLNLVRARNVSHGSESGPPPLEKLEIDEQSAPGWVAAEVTKNMGAKFVIRASK